MARLRPNQFYKTKARIFRDSSQECTVRWFRVPDGTPFLPTEYFIGGRPWQYDRGMRFSGVGELNTTPMVWDRGDPPPLPSQWLGDNDWWLNGVPISALGGPSNQTRPGVCRQVRRMACNAGCDQCEFTSDVWLMDDFPDIGNLKSKALVHQEGCLWSNRCYKDNAGCPAGTARAWEVVSDDAIPTLTDGLIIARGADRFTSCCLPQ